MEIVKKFLNVYVQEVKVHQRAKHILRYPIVFGLCKKKYQLVKRTYQPELSLTKREPLVECVVAEERGVMKLVEKIPCFTKVQANLPE